MFIGAMTIIFCHHLLGTTWLHNVIIGSSIIIISNIVPNGKPFFLNLYQMGRVYILFDANLREITLIQTRFGGLRTTKTTVCSYSQFRGIAVHYKTRRVLLLCKREESLLLDAIGDVLPNKAASIEDVLSQISVFWFQWNESDAFFGITFVDFSDGIVAEGNVHLNIDYDYYLKDDNEWKPKNDMLAQNGLNVLKMKHIEDMAMDKDQLLDVKKSKFHSVNGPSMTMDSEHEPICDYV